MAKRRPKGTITVDFGHPDAKGGGGRVHIPPGDYPAKIVEVEETESESSGNRMLVWRLQITDGKYEGKKLLTRTVITPKALWRLRNLIEATGSTVPDKAVNLRPNKYVGEEIGIVVDDDEYENRVYSDIRDFVSIEDLTEEEEEEEEEDEEDEEEDEEPEDEVEDEEEEEDEEELEEVDLDEL
jgi:hypothetical protein